MADTVQQIKDKLSIADVVSEYVKLERAGASLKGRCPFHSEKTPSFFVSPDRGSYHCFGCDVGGDMFTFIQEIEGVDFKGALHMLADKAGVQVVYEKGEKRDERDRLYLLLETATLFFIRELGEKHPGRVYLHSRGITDDTIKSFRIGFAPDNWSAITEYLKEKGYTEKEIEIAGLTKRNDKTKSQRSPYAQSESRGAYDRFRSRIMFPIMDSAGRVVAFSGRHLDTKSWTSDVQYVGHPMSNISGESNFEPAKYINSPETPVFRKSHILYGYDRARQPIRKLNFSLLVEGQMDLIASHQAGWGNTVAVSGTALTPQHVTLLKRMSDNILVALDADPAGIAAATKSARIALKEGMEVKVAELPEGMDPSDIIEKKGNEEWKKIIRHSKHIITFLLDSLERGAKDGRQFQKSVESVVLPFLHITNNPIDRESFKHTIAERLNVSESAIDEVLLKIPAEENSVSVQNEKRMSLVKDEGGKRYIHPRISQLWGIILWQKEKENAEVDARKVQKRLFEIIGKESSLVLKNISKEEEEKLLFAVESIYTEAGAVKKVVDEFLQIIERDSIKKKLVETTAQIRAAELEGSQEKETQLKETHKIYTDRLAELQKKV